MWIIPHWKRVLQHPNALETQTYELKTGKSTRGQTNWLVGFKTFDWQNEFRVYLKLTETKGFPDEFVQATVTCSLLRKDSIFYWTETKDAAMKIGHEFQIDRDLLRNLDEWEHFINPNGEVAFEFKLGILDTYVLWIPSWSCFIPHQLHRCMQILLNFLAMRQLLTLKLWRVTRRRCLLTSVYWKVTALRKILLFPSINKDKKACIFNSTQNINELLKNFAIYNVVQCPVFDTMFHSEFSEERTGIVNVKDVSAKTMGIFLQLFYTWELLPSWKDEDTVAEFTYAVGKYQLTNVLELLNGVLGSRDEKDATHTDFRLLDLARKLNLTTAEKELLERIKRTVSKVESSEGLFELYGFGNE